MHEYTITIVEYMHDLIKKWFTDYEQKCRTNECVFSPYWILFYFCHTYVWEYSSLNRCPLILFFFLLVYPSIRLSLLKMHGKYTHIQNISLTRNVIQEGAHIIMCIDVFLSFYLSRPLYLSFSLSLARFSSLSTSFSMQRFIRSCFINITFGFLNSVKGSPAHLAIQN